MSAPGWSLLDEKEEAELHKSRLLNVEEKPFKRLTKRLRSINEIIAQTVRQTATPPPEGPASNGTADAAAAASVTPPDDSAAAEALSVAREDIALDFAAFDSSVARLQFLLTANARERERYAADRVRIQDTSRRVRDDTTALRTRLEAARETLGRRKKFDELAEQIAANKALRPRAEQAAALAKLEDECAQLEAESEEYSRTWRERREQFEKIMEESMRLRRQIRDEKEEVERREGMDDEGTTGGEVEDGPTPRHGGLVSGNATPMRTDGGGSGTGAVPSLVARVGGLESAEGSGTPRPSTVGGRTPAREGSAAPEGTSQASLKLLPGDARSFSRGGSRGPSREGTPRPGAGDADVEMGDVKSSRSSPLTPDPDDGKDEVPSISLEGKDNAQDKMDTT